VRRVAFFITGMITAFASTTVSAEELLQADSTRRVAPPFGVLGYCAEQTARLSTLMRSFRRSLCTGTEAAAVVELTVERRRELDLVQRRVNADLTYERTVSWDPLVERGDCKNYAARKLLELLQRGWPAGAMRLATAFVEEPGEFRDEYHAVLLVDTSAGTYVLDNLQDAPRPFGDLNYVWVMSQLPGHGDWARLPANDVAFAHALQRHRLLRPSRLAAGR
jgi:predicted transglutaminase-like cysteine proteinase